MFTSTYKAKKYLLSIKDNKCEQCNNSQWNNKPISLQLHHIDGNNKNHTITNLQLLCPNCHSQTHNYAGKNKRNTMAPKNHQSYIDAINSSFSIYEASCKLGFNSVNYKKFRTIISNNKAKLLVKTKLPITNIEHNINTKLKLRRVSRPTKEILEIEITQFPFLQLSKKYGVSDNAIRKWCRSYNITLPTNMRGYWRKKETNII